MRQKAQISYITMPPKPKIPQGLGSKSWSGPRWRQRSSLNKSCPVFPSRCPFGGACHTCPVRVQTKPRINRPVDNYEEESDHDSIQPKLILGEANDQYEQDADRLADQVMGNGKVHDPANAMISPCSQDALRCQSRMDEEEREEEKREEEEEDLVQAKQLPGQTMEVTPSLNYAIALSQRSGGMPLSFSEKGFFEHRFGHTFDQVRVHADVNAANAAHMFRAQAFTHGQHIFFGSGYYQPHTRAGRWLLAHELAHTIQQQSPDGNAIRCRTTAATVPFAVEESSMATATIETSEVETMLSSSDHPAPSEESPVPLSRRAARQRRIYESAPSEPRRPAEVSTAESPAGQHVPAPTESTAISGLGEGAPEIAVDISNSAKLLLSLSTIPPSSFGHAMTEANQTAIEIQTRERSDLDSSMPEIKSPTGMPRIAEPPQREETVLVEGTAPEPESSGVWEELPPEIQYEESRETIPVTRPRINISEPAKEENDNWWNWLTGAVNRLLGRLPAHDPGLNTSAGPRPHVDLTGEADPTRNQRIQQASDEEVALRRTKADQAATPTPQSQQPIQENNQETVTDIGVPLYMQRTVAFYGGSPPPVQRKPELTIGAMNDIYEKEADEVADKVMRMPASSVAQPFDEEQEELTQQPASIQTKSITPLYIQPMYMQQKYIQRMCTACEEELQQPASANVATPSVQRKHNGEHSLSSDHHVAKLIQSPTGGSALPDHVKSRVGSVLGSDLNHVRIHDDTRSNDAAHAINAKAFTHQNHIYLEQGQSANDVSLMAHEATHVVQQTSGGTGAVALQRSPGDDEGGFWSSVGESISSTGETLLGYGRAGVTAVGEGISSAVETGSEVVSNVTGMTRDAIIGILEERAPGALAFFRGLRNFINEGITGGFDSIFSGVAESYQEGGIGCALEYIFVDLAGGALSGIGNFIAGSCAALGDAANWLLDIGRRLGAETITAVTAGATAVANFLNGLWDRYGAPAAEAIRGFISGIWDSITETISEWWDRLEPLRTAAREVWDWLTGTIMEGMQSLDALLTHVFEWAVAKWDELKEQLRPFMGYVKALAVALLLMSPLGPFIAAGAAAYGLYRLIQYLWEIWGQPLVAEIRQVVVEEILPRVMSGITFLEEKLEEAKQWLLGVADDLVNLGAQLLEAIGVLPVLRLAQRAILWINNKLQQFGERVRAALEQFATSVHQLLQRAYEFFRPVLEFLQQTLLIVLFGPWAILDDGVWETVNRVANFAMTVPCICELAGLMQVPAILDMAAQFRTMMKSAWQVIQNPEPIWDAFHDAIEPMVSAVPGAAATILAGAIYPTEPEHRRGVEAYLLPAIEHLQEHWWDELKHIGWTLLWPWDEVAERFPMLLQHGWDAITNLFNLEIGAAIDSFLLVMQDVNSVLGAVWGWFAIAAVLIGGVLGALGVEFTAGASIGAGMAAGWALAEDVGIGLLVAMGATEMAIIGKSMFDIRFTNETIEDERQRLEANGRDYQAIANSTFTIAVLTALVLLGELAGRLASSIWSKISGRLPSFEALEEFLNRPRGCTRETAPGEGIETRPGRPGETQIGDEQAARRMETGAKSGVEPTPESIRTGTVRMEQHPNYHAVISEIENLGFRMRTTSKAPHVSVWEIVSPDGVRLRVEKTVHVQEGMRFLDLEHELGHVYQLTERFGGEVRPTERFIEMPDGSLSEVKNPPTSEVLTKWQDTITEYHNRLDEFIRLSERGASRELLVEHAEGVARWRAEYWNEALKRGREASRLQWAKDHFPDIRALVRRYNELGGSALE